MGSWTLIEAKADDTGRDASRDLFLWAVVQKNKELAEIAWEQVSEARTVCCLCVCVCVTLNDLCALRNLHSVKTACPLLWLPVRS